MLMLGAFTIIRFLVSTNYSKFAFVCWEIQKARNIFQCCTILWILEEPSILILYLFQNQRIISFGSLKNIHNKKTINSDCFKNLKESMICDIFILKNLGCIQKTSFLTCWEPTGKWIYTWFDNWQVSVPNSKNSPTLVCSQTIGLL